jgi:hypothetical protein
MEINQKDSEEFYNKGVELGDLGKNEEAVVCYDKVLEINMILMHYTIRVSHWLDLENTEEL